jgi:hypothetical protein
MMSLDTQAYLHAKCILLLFHFHQNWNTLTSLGKIYISEFSIQLSGGAGRG